MVGLGGILIVGENSKLSAKIEELLGSEFEIKRISDTDDISQSERVKNYDLVIARPGFFVSAKISRHNSASESIIRSSYVQKILSVFSARRGNIDIYLSDICKELTADIQDSARAHKMLCDIFNAALEEVFDKNEWMELYLAAEDFEADNSQDRMQMLITLYKEYISLLPPVQSVQIEQIILHILNNPDTDLKQKDIATEMHINSSYLSTVFSAQTDMRFVDYITNVKMKRAGHLLKYTDLKVNEIAMRLDYKDIGYFSRLFKNQYGMSPSQYRMPGNYTYMI